MSRTLLSLAGFQMILSGRWFWVIAEGSTDRWPQSTRSQKIQYFDGQFSRRGDIHIAVQIVTNLVRIFPMDARQCQIGKPLRSVYVETWGMAVVPVLPMFAVRSKRVAQSVDFIALPLKRNFSGIEALNGNAREELHSGTPASARLALSTSPT